MRFILLALMSAFAFSCAVYAQDEKLSYEPVGFKEFAKLLWRYDVLGLANDEVLDHYLAVTQCDLYKQYRKMEFTWQKIRAGNRLDIEYYAHDYPNRFYINAVVPLERYDFDKAAFIVDEKYALMNAGSIQIPVEVVYEGCDLRDAMSVFPWDIKFSADNKFSLSEIPVAPDKAQAILERIKKYQYKELAGKMAVPLRFEIQVNGVKKYEDNQEYASVVFKGQLDTITFFEDPQMMTPMWKKEFKILD